MQIKVADAETQQMHGRDPLLELFIIIIQVHWFCWPLRLELLDESYSFAITIQDKDSIVRILIYFWNGDKNLIKMD